jgi:hypothetical protein
VGADPVLGLEDVPDEHACLTCRFTVGDAFPVTKPVTECLQSMHPVSKGPKLMRRTPKSGTVHV